MQKKHVFEKGYLRNEKSKIYGIHGIDENFFQLSKMLMAITTTPLVRPAR